jgi:cytochrome b involved in lipid metabolism
MKNIKPLYIALSLLVLIIGLGIFLFPKKSSNISASDSSVATKVITMAEVAKHPDQNSCWMVIEGNVYDVTSYIPEHQGGNAILMGCGKDATQMFNSRPNDGTPHGSRAKSMLSGFQIGILAK